MGKLTQGLSKWALSYHISDWGKVKVKVAQSHLTLFNPHGL